MKKIIAVLIGVVVLLTCCIIPASAEEDLVTIERGEQVELIVSVDAYTGIKSGSIAFTYDENVFEIISGEWLINGTFITDFKLTDGKGVFACVSAIYVRGNIFKLVLRVKDDASFGAAEITADIQFKNNSTGELFAPNYSVSYVVGCNHVFSESYNYDENGHGYTCLICEGEADGGIRDFVEHSFDNVCDANCDVCGFERDTHHISSDWIVDQEATFDTDGSMHKECIKCGEILETETIPMLSHVFGAVVTLPTCTEEGYTTYTCTDCGYSYIRDYVPATGHSFGEWTTTVYPTCTEDGQEKRVCSECGASETNAIAALGHDYANEWTVDVEATCTSVGSKSHHCNTCGDKADITEIPMIEHSFGEWTNTVYPTCTEDGQEKRVCSECGASETNAVAALGHTPADAVVENNLDPTCTSVGYYENVVYCSVCEEELSRDNVTVEALGHTYVGESVESTCTTLGYTVYTCVCGDSYTVYETEFAPHHYVAGEPVESTCTVFGYTVYTCECGDNYTVYETELAAHIYAPAVTEATCTTMGYTTYTCECGEEYIADFVDALGHDCATEWTVDVEATCTSVGSKSHHCNTCGDKMDITEIPMIEHSFGEWTTTVYPTCTEDGLEERICPECGASETNAVAALGHDYADEWTVDVDPMCTVVGRKSRHCNNCSDIIDVTEIPATGHNFINYESNNDATYIADGTMTGECENCDTVDTKADLGSALGLTQKFKDEMAVLSSNAENAEITYAELYSVLQTYAALSNEEKDTVVTEFAELQEMVAAYNAKVQIANGELAEASEVALASVVPTGFAFLAALWFLLKKKFFI